MTSRSYLVEQPRDPARPWAPSPFKRLARTHALSVAGDAIFTTAMAGLVFFNVSDLSQARWRVAMALVFTILPFSVAAPFLGPLIDRARGGRKWMIVGLSAGRALVCALLVWDRGNSFLMYPQFLFALVFAKGYVIAKGALVPTTVRSDTELVQANAKLAAISGIAAVAGGLPAIIVMWVASKLGSDHGPDIALLLASVVYVATIVQAVQLPSVRIADEPADEAEVTELHSAGIRHAAQAISLTRGTVGFLTFMLAFHFKDLEATDPTASKVGLVGSVIGGQAGFMLGAAIAPALRRQLSEERMLMVSLATTTIAAVLTALMGELAGATLLAFGVGLTSNTAKQAFDSIVQRDAPDANRGRAFARFETRFQLVWVTGALIPVAIAIPIRAGFVLIAICCGTALLLYYVGLRRAVEESKRRPSPLAGEPVLVEPKPASRTFLRRRPAVGATPDQEVTVVATDADRAPGPSGIDSTMVVAPATVAAAPMSASPRVVPSGQPAAPVPWGTGSVPASSVPPAPIAAPGSPASGAGPARADELADAYAATTEAPAGLFGSPDAPIPASLTDSPVAGLFSLGDAVAVPPTPDVGAPGTGDTAGSAEPPVFYDGSAWIDEDDPSLDSPVVDAPVGELPVVEPPSASRPFVNPDGSYPEPVWRDADPATPDPTRPA